MFEKSGVLVKQGNRLRYIDKAGEEHLYFRKGWNADTLPVILKEQGEGVVLETVEDESVLEEIEED
jgi:hypothetical protein